MNIWTLISVSRPRFWLYLAGTYLVGAALGFEVVWDAVDPLFWAYFVFFAFPANVFLYGINDYFDTDTDALNTKKGSKEHQLKQAERAQLKVWLYLGVIMFSLLIYLQPNWWLRGLLILFILVSSFYSAPPLRFKARPIVDFLSNAFYVIPGIIGYIHASDTLPDWFIVWGFCCWTFAMHLFSAIPDIEPDKNAELKTTAVWLGKQQSLIVCGIFWAIFSLICISLPNWRPWSLFTLIYPLIPLLLVIESRIKLIDFYWLFPYLNGFFGFAVYWLAVSKLI